MLYIIKPKSGQFGKRFSAKNHTEARRYFRKKTTVAESRLYRIRVNGRWDLIEVHEVN